MSRDIVLLITHSGDYFTIDRVAEALTKRNAPFFRLDTDLFPMSVQLVTSLSNSGVRHQLRHGNTLIDAEQIRSVWMRRLWPPQLSQELAPQFQAACARESLATLEGFFDGLRDVPWVDYLSSIREAANKVRQLQIAAAVGLQIPPTRVTNCPEEVQAFFQAVSGKMVTKLLTPLSVSMKGSPFFLYTSTVKAEDLIELSSLRFSPMVFQTRIPKQKELRAVFVAGKLFVGAADASRYEATTIDWRCAEAAAFKWQRDNLPPPVVDRLSALMQTLRLSFGAIDLIQMPDGEYVFLEVNPTGEWGMLERDLDYPISEAIAELLIRENQI
ncbi:MvdC family ATP-grasp ribosomal peptide maturase [Phormidium tenue FACHB-886]|nr:MvdC family ATP-grasp ribosomal peptide maturase [Phormidium tenue FACHB-886]